MISSAGVAAASRWLARHRARILAAIALGAIAIGGAFHLLGEPGVGDAIWRTVLVLLTVELAVEVGRTVLVEHNMGVDTIALVAMVGSLVLGELLAGVVIGLMFSGGRALEEIASARARAELTALVERAPRRARVRVGGEIRDVPVEAVEEGDVAIVRTGEVIPVDGTLESGRAVVDTSTLTGEPLPVSLSRGMSVLSGTANAGTPFEIRATRPAAESAYAALVRLVSRAETERAPLVRMADRYAGFFLSATMLIAGLAWALSGDAVRGLAVVVVATPCPLILAAPIALVSGLSRAAKAGVIVKSTGAIETLGQVRTVLFDKTGTLTTGTPEVSKILPRDGLDPDEILTLAASVDSMSAHVLGAALREAAREADLPLREPGHVVEDPGQGIAGTIDGRRVAVGSRDFLVGQGIPRPQLELVSDTAGKEDGEARVWVGVEGAVAGVIVMADELRPEAADIVARLRKEGVRHVGMVSGDRRSVAERVGRELGIDSVYAEQSPQEKLEVIEQLRDAAGRSPVMMVGDGVNDAPALAIADVGVAMGVAGATVSSQTADAVITVDRIDRVADAIHAGRGALRIARQSVIGGMGLSLAAMGVAALGYLPPLSGALLQEAIDLAVILNALRALRV